MSSRTRAGHFSPVVLISWRQTRSGLVSFSHSSRRGSRPLTPLTLYVATFSGVTPSYGVIQRIRYPVARPARRPRSQSAVFAFDVLQLCAKDLRALPPSKRKAKLQQELRGR